MENETAYAPGGKEREELEAEFERIREAALPPRTMLPSDLSGEVVEKCYSALCDAADKFGSGMYTKEISADMANRAKNNYIKARRAEKWHGELIQKDHERYMRQGQTFKKLIDCDEKTVSLEEWFEFLLEYIDCHYNEVEEKILKEKFRALINRINEGAPKAKKSSKKEVRHKYGEYQNVLLTDAEFEKLKAEFPSDCGERIERLSEYIASTGKSYKNYLATIRSWAKKDKPKAVNKQSVFGSDASYDIGEFEKNIAGLKYLDEE